MVRDSDDDPWELSIFCNYVNKHNEYGYKVVALNGCRWKQCIPLNDYTEKLAETTNAYIEPSIVNIVDKILVRNKYYDIWEYTKLTKHNHDLSKNKCVLYNEHTYHLLLTDDEYTGPYCLNENTIIKE